MRSEGEDNPRKQVVQQPHGHHLKNKLKILLLVVLTNLLTFYISTVGPLNTLSPISTRLGTDYSTTSTTATATATASLLEEFNSTKAELHASYDLIADLRQKINSTNLLVQSLLIELTRTDQQKPSTSSDSDNDNDFGIGSMSDEVKLAILPQKLPLGHSPRMDSDQIYPPIGAGCLKYEEELARYMTYDIGKECPMDDVFTQKLMLKGCDPLPRRRCHPKSPIGYVEPMPLPDSLWATPPDSSIVWDPYTCKNYQCLIERGRSPRYVDCKDCFDLRGRESQRWLNDRGLDYGLDQVIQTKPPGTIRIGLDIGGGSGTFAARMRERNITIVTTTMNLDGPFNSFIASRGLIPMHLSVTQRLPFFDNTLDIVHSMHVLSNWIPDAMLELTLYDIYRVLRPGGLFWLDHFFCQGSQLEQTYVPMFDRIGFNKLRWNSGRKLDRGPNSNEWYFSALLEKPMT